MIVAFADREAQRIFDGSRSRKYRGLEHVIERKLRSLHRAVALNDLRVPPGNRLEMLKRDRAGQYSIRINDQYRICFEWEGGHASQVEITDYH